MDERQVDKLLVKISRGDNVAFEDLYNNTRRGVFSFLYSYFKNYEDTEDAMQTVYLKVKLNIAQYSHGTNGRAWLLQIAKNCALNELHKKKYEERIDENTIMPAQNAYSGEVATAMRKVLSPEEERIVILHVLWGYKHREIAKELNCPVGTVTSKYKRSISKLKEVLKEEEE